MDLCSRTPLRQGATALLKPEKAAPCTWSWCGSEEDASSWLVAQLSHSFQLSVRSQKGFKRLFAVRRDRAAPVSALPTHRGTGGVWVLALGWVLWLSLLSSLPMPGCEEGLRCQLCHPPPPKQAAASKCVKFLSCPPGKSHDTSASSRSSAWKAAATGEFYFNLSQRLLGVSRGRITLCDPRIYFQTLPRQPGLRLFGDDTLL